MSTFVRHGLMLSVALLAFAARTGDLRVAANELEDPVEAAQRELRRGDFPWYDRAEDSIDPIPVEPAPPVARHRDSSWESKPRAPRQRQPARSTRSWRGAGGILEILAWIILAILIVAIISGLAWAYWRSDRSRERRRSESSAANEDLSASFENLPFVLQAERPDLLAEARRTFEAGNYRRSIILLFSYELIALDQRQRILLTKGKTNRQYLRELRGHPVLQQIVEQTMELFERTYFGDSVPQRSELEVAWQQLEVFQRELEAVPV